MLNPGQPMIRGQRYFFNFDHYGLSIYTKSGIRGDLFNSGLPIQLNDVLEHWVGDITVDFVWLGDSSVSVNDVGEMLADAMSTWYLDIRMKFNSASIQQSEATVKPSDDIDNSLPNPDDFSKLLTYAAIILGVLVFLDFGGASLVKGAVKEITE